MTRRRWSLLAVCAAALGLLAAGVPVSVLAEPVGNDCLAVGPPDCQLITAGLRSHSD